MSILATPDVQSLPSRFFQPALSSSVNGHPSGLASDLLGDVLTELDDIEQCIRIILTTPRGSDPHRPLFGSNLHLYIDYPINSARPNIVREAVNALREWEPRIEVVKVSVTLADIAMLACVVEWKFTPGAEATFVTNLMLGAMK